MGSEQEREPVIVSAVRTPVGKFGGGLLDFTAPQLGGLVVKEAVSRAGLEAGAVQEVIMGNVVSAGLGQNPARQAALRAGLPPQINAMTINKVCGSGLKAVALAAQSIRAGDEKVLVAGGMESMSNAPYLLQGARWGYRLGHGKLVDSVIHDGLWCCFNDFHMGMSAELVADRYGISRSEQDEFALASHQKAVAAARGGKFAGEIQPVLIEKSRSRTVNGPAVLERDEGPREDTSMEALSRLKPAFKEGGSVTAGNAPGLSDGAAALVVMSLARAEDLGIKPVARILGYQAAGVEPKWVMMAPVEAVRELLKRLQMKIGSFDLIELNEAFSVQALAVMKELEMDPRKVNVHGGAVALGHPIGASGARILVTLLHALKSCGKKLGLAALCLGGGNAVAMAVELV